MTISIRKYLKIGFGWGRKLLLAYELFATLPGLSRGVSFDFAQKSKEKIDYQKGGHINQRNDIDLRSRHQTPIIPRVGFVDSRCVLPNNDREDLSGIFQHPIRCDIDLKKMMNTCSVYPSIRFDTFWRETLRLFEFDQQERNIAYRRAIIVALLYMQWERNMQQYHRLLKNNWNIVLSKLFGAKIMKSDRNKKLYHYLNTFTADLNRNCIENSSNAAKTMNESSKTTQFVWWCELLCGYSASKCETCASNSDEMNFLQSQRIGGILIDDEMQPLPTNTIFFQKNLMYIKHFQNTSTKIAISMA